MRQRKNGFTLVELLVVIGLIALLIGFLLPTLARARKTAYEARSMSNLRQLMLGYAFYIQENRGALPWAYPPASVNGVATKAYDPVSKQELAWPVSARYPWRIIKYVSNVWPILHGHVETPDLTLPTDDAATAASKAYTLSLAPTYGINCAYVGGDAERGEGFAGGTTPVYGKSCVFKASEVRHPTNLIVFADCHQGNAPASGFYRLMAPRANGVWWSVINHKAVPSSPTSSTGIPMGWYTSRVVTGFFDGHIESLLPDDLSDMRKWCARATRSDWDYATATP